MIRINTQTLTFALGCLLLGASSCSRENDFQSGDKSLKVTVQMAVSSMVTRGEVAPSIVSDTVALTGDLKFVASSRLREYEPEEALTRGTPIKSAANLPSMNIKVYNSGTGSFSSATALTTTLKGTNSSGAWSLSPAYVLKDDEKSTYMAYCPIEDANNGIVVPANGRTINYTAPTTVTNQPDLCSAAIVKDDVSGYLSLAMQHQLTAVGIKGMGNWVQINSIVLSNVYSSGTLDLETGAWSNLGAKTNFTPGTTQSSLSTNGAMNDITAANGYLMLPPQNFTADNQTITVKYKYTKDAGSTEQTATYKLKNLTGGKWTAGQIVMYEIQLKSYFSLTLNPASLTLTEGAGTASFTYSTNSPSTNDPQFNNGGNAWITNISVNRSTKTVTFSYTASTSGSDRKAAIKATSGWTAADCNITQKSMPVVNLSESSWSAGSGIGGQTKTITVTTNGCRWKVVDPGKDGNWSRVALSRTEGASGESVTITVKGNPQKANRSFNVAFEAVRATNDIPYVSKNLNIQQNKIAQYEVSNAHTAFVPSDLLSLDTNKGLWMADKNNDLKNSEQKVSDTGGKWGTDDNGEQNSLWNYGYIYGINHCRDKFGSRGYPPAINELPLWIPNNKPANVPERFTLHAPSSAGGFYTYATSTVAHKPGDWFQHKVVRVYSYKTEIIHEGVKQYSALHHRCVYKQNP